jgi:hypothetical protein
LIRASGECVLNDEMRLPHILFALLVLSACTTRITRDPVIQPQPVIEPKPVAPGTPLIGEIRLNAATKINGIAQPAFPDRPGESWLLIRQIYDANDNVPSSQLKNVIQIGSTIIVSNGFSMQAYGLEGQALPSYFSQIHQLFQDSSDDPGSYSMFGQGFSSPLLIRWSEMGFTAIQLEYDGRITPYAFYDGVASIYSPGFEVGAVISTKNGWLISSNRATRFNPDRASHDMLETEKYVSYMLC